LKKFHQQIKYWEKKRATLQAADGVCSNAKGIYLQYPQLKRVNEKLNEIRTKYRSMLKTYKKNKENLPESKKELRFAKNREEVFWSQYMTQLKLFYRFYNLFLLSKEAYPQARAHFLVMIKKKESETLAKELIRILTDVTEIKFLLKFFYKCKSQYSFYVIFKF
jgi:hypothetical protein